MRFAQITLRIIVKEMMTDGSRAASTAAIIQLMSCSAGLSIVHVHRRPNHGDKIREAETQ